MIILVIGLAAAHAFKAGTDTVLMIIHIPPTQAITTNGLQLAKDILHWEIEALIGCFLISKKITAQGKLWATDGMPGQLVTIRFSVLIRAQTLRIEAVIKLDYLYIMTL